MSIIMENGNKNKDEENTINVLWKINNLNIETNNIKLNHIYSNNLDRGRLKDIEYKTRNNTFKEKEKNS